MTHLLVYAQDPGGAQNVALVAKQLVKSTGVSITITVHPLARTIFEEFHLPFQVINEKGFPPPLGEEQAEEFLTAGGFTHVLCGTSNLSYDPTNSNIIRACRKLGISCFGLMEHWKGWDRFYSQDGKLTCVPDLLGCIDSFSAAKLERIGIPQDRLIIVGQPHLEWLSQQARAGAFSDGKPGKQIILVSQPLVSKDFESLLGLSLDSHSLAECLGSVFAELRQTYDFTVCYRPHPKEKPLARLPRPIVIDKQLKWTDTLRESAIVIGLDSMALIEAFFAGKMCISLNFPSLAGLSDMSCPIEFARKVNSIDEFKVALGHALAGDRRHFPSIGASMELIEKSTDRVLAVLSKLMKQSS